MLLSALRGLPWFVFGWSPRRDAAPRDTAWLDGMRGMAACLVMINHYNLSWLSSFVEAPFGATVLQNQNPDGINFHHEGDRLWAPWRLPVLKLFMVSGGAQVAIFFLISGMVLSWGPIGKVQAERYDELYSSLGSSVVRRWFRLFLPCALVGSLYMVRDIAMDYKGVLPALHTVWDYIKETERWSNPFELTHFNMMDSLHSFSIVMWTIPIEFAGSMFVYVLLLSFGRIRHLPRRACAILLVSWWAFAKGQWGLWLFGHGVVIADYVRESGGFREMSRRATILSSTWWTLVLLLGLALMGYVPGSNWFDKPGYQWLDQVPLPPSFRQRSGAERAFWGVGGICVVLSCCHLSLSRRLFETALMQHLGKISFMLYLIHFWINFTVGEVLKNAIYDSFCPREIDALYDKEVYRASNAFKTGVYLLLLLITCTTTFIASHVLEVVVDRPCTAFGKWIDDKLVRGVRRKEKNILADEERELLDTSDTSSTRTIEMEQVRQSVEYRAPLLPT